MAHYSYHYIATVFGGLSLCAMLGLTGCQKSGGAVATAAKALVDPSVETRDVNRDGRVDSWLYYAIDDGRKTIIKRRHDLNFDGKVDITQHFTAKLLTLEEIDLDFDGVVDMRNWYEKGLPLRSELDLGFDGRVDVWRFYEAGKLIRKERDSNADGKADHWEYYEEGELKRAGRDVNFDGDIDVWD